MGFFPLNAVWVSGGASGNRVRYYCALHVLMCSPFFLRRIWELPLPILRTLHRGETRWAERNRNREESQHPQREAFSPQTRLWPGKKTTKKKKKTHTHPSSSVLSTIGDQEISFYWFSIQIKHIQAILIPDRFRFEYMILPDLIAFIFGSKWEGRDASRHPIEKNTLSSLTFCLWPPFPK